MEGKGWGREKGSESRRIGVRGGTVSTELNPRSQVGVYSATLQSNSPREGKKERRGADDVSSHAGLQESCVLQEYSSDSTYNHGIVV